MTTPLLALLMFAAWAIFLVLLIGFYRWKCVLTGTVPEGGFPSDMPPPDGWYRRVLQAHKNCLENLVIFGAISLIIASLGLSSPALDNLAITIIAARVMQSLIHIILNQTRPIVMLRFTFYLIQVVAFIWMITIVLYS